MENRAWEIIHCHLCFLFPPAFEARGAPKNHWKSAQALLVALFVGCRLETLFLNNSALSEEGLLGLEVQSWAISPSYHQPKPWVKLGYFLVNTLQCRSRINKSNHWSNSEYKETVQQLVLILLRNQRTWPVFHPSQCFITALGTVTLLPNGYLQIYFNFH